MNGFGCVTHAYQTLTSSVFLREAELPGPDHYFGDEGAKASYSPEPRTLVNEVVSHLGLLSRSGCAVTLQRKMG